MNLLIGQTKSSMSGTIELTGLYFRNIQEACFLLVLNYWCIYNSKLLTSGPMALGMALQVSTVAIVAVLGSMGRRAGPKASVVGP